MAIDGLIILAIFDTIWVIILWSIFTYITLVELKKFASKKADGSANPTANTAKHALYTTVRFFLGIYAAIMTLGMIGLWIVALYSLTTGGKITLEAALPPIAPLLVPLGGGKKSSPESTQGYRDY